MIGPAECDVCHGSGEQVAPVGASADPFAPTVAKECGPCDGTGYDLEKRGTFPPDWAVEVVRYLEPEGRPVAVSTVVKILLDETPLGEGDAELAIERALKDGFLRPAGELPEQSEYGPKKYVSIPCGEGA